MLVNVGMTTDCVWTGLASRASAFLAQDMTEPSLQGPGVAVAKHHNPIVGTSPDSGCEQGL